ncbi:hypothetical protein BDA96_03G006800 [Sorghum bicolor]|uniref:Uncharacterized protein n=1 Tax=Sorghum bicolor TaxID=4558 RepID=A0A921RB42_SORBI|nr:hypothetical protein BDA96_03G006800 [Sorghum bicolor]
MTAVAFAPMKPWVPWWLRIWQRRSPACVVLPWLPPMASPPLGVAHSSSSSALCHLPLTSFVPSPGRARPRRSYRWFAGTGGSWRSSHLSSILLDAGLQCRFMSLPLSPSLPLDLLNNHRRMLPSSIRLWHVMRAYS